MMCVFVNDLICVCCVFCLFGCFDLLLGWFFYVCIQGGCSLFQKILIVNWGEIVCWVIKMVCKMGIRMVVVYFDVDWNVLYVKMVDEVVYIGLSFVNQFYIVIDKIMDVICQIGVQVVYFGYGFLFENWKFVEVLECEGVVFIGLFLGVIEVMGDKIILKKIV